MTAQPLIDAIQFLHIFLNIGKRNIIAVEQFFFV